MTINYKKWIKKYDYTDYSIEFRGSSGGWEEDDDPLFPKISAEFQSRGHIYRDELRKIARWKAQSRRLDRHIKDNSPHEVEHQSQLAFHASSPGEAADHLSELSGVGVPVASSVLSMAYPSSYAVIDFRALRALPITNPGLVDPQNYTEYADYMDHFRGYGTRPGTYDFYMDNIRNIASTENLTPREVEIALWTYDKKH